MAKWRLLPLRKWEAVWRPRGLISIGIGRLGVAPRGVPTRIIRKLACGFAGVHVGKGFGRGAAIRNRAKKIPKIIKASPKAW